MLGYQFAADHCKNVDFFFYQDDDIFMKFDAFLDSQDLSNPNPFMICPMGGSPPSNPQSVSSESTNAIFTMLFQRTNYFRKHYSPIDLLPPQYRILPYCNGPCVFMSRIRFNTLIKRNISRLENSSNIRV